MDGTSDTDALSKSTTAAPDQHQYEYIKTSTSFWASNRLPIIFGVLVTLIIGILIGRSAFPEKRTVTVTHVDTIYIGAADPNPCGLLSSSEIAAMLGTNAAEIIPAYDTYDNVCDYNAPAGTENFTLMQVNTTQSYNAALASYNSLYMYATRNNIRNPYVTSTDSSYAIAGEQFVSTGGGGQSLVFTTDKNGLYYTFSLYSQDIRTTPQLNELMGDVWLNIP